MLEAIERNPDLQRISRRACAENKAEVEICPDLLIGDDLDDAQIKILKVDEYYNTKDFAAPPKAIDCVIVVKCASGTFELTLVELRDVKATRGLRPRDIIEKFKTTFRRFLAVDFVDVFGSPEHEVSDIRAWLISDPFKASALSEEQYQRRIRGTVLDVVQSTKPFAFRQHRVMISPLRPFPRPVVCTCPDPSTTELSDQKAGLPQDRRPGSAKGRLRIVTEDDEHLGDFQNHMR